MLLQVTVLRHNSLYFREGADGKPKVWTSITVQLRWTALARGRHLLFSTVRKACATRSGLECLLPEIPGASLHPSYFAYSTAFPKWNSTVTPLL
jgi:hypothetical protein